jgi:hypothetical protein
MGSAVARMQKVRDTGGFAAGLFARTAVSTAYG